MEYLLAHNRWSSEINIDQCITMGKSHVRIVEAIAQLPFETNIEFYTNVERI